MKRIAIVGGGFTGIGAAYYLKDFKNTEVTIFEAEKTLGGLAGGIRTRNWNWPVDKLIHHWFEGDKWALGIAKEIGLEKKIIIKNVKSSCFYNGEIAELDSPSSLIRLPFLNIFDRIRTGVVMAYLRLDKGYLKYEKKTSVEFIKKYMGKKSFSVLWEPLFKGKFGDYYSEINAAWFWSRIHPRTKSLAYIEGGFQKFLENLRDYLGKYKMTFLMKTKVQSIKKFGEKFILKFDGGEKEFDVVVLAIPFSISKNLFDFPKDYLKKCELLRSIGAQYFVLELKESFLEDGTYWLNINDSSFPFMMVAEHTNFIDKKNYGKNHIVWIGKYLDYNNEMWKMNKKELLEKVIPFMKKINPRFNESWIKRSFFNRFYDAQPIVEKNYSQIRPTIDTPIRNLFVANMHHIYPWDRGTNNALGLGQRVAKKIAQENHLR